jgi:hypothetical protein
VNPSIYVDRSNHRMVWIYNRENYERTLSNQLENALSELNGKPFVFLIDLRSLRYILPLDRIMIFHIIEKSKPYNLAYLVNSFDHMRMNTIISVNQFPFKDMVFKYQANAIEYLDTLEKMQQRKVSLVSR